MKIIRWTRQVFVVKGSLLFLIIFPLAIKIDAQTINIPEQENRISIMFERMKQTKDDSQKLIINNEIKAELSDLLAGDSSFSYLFDSLKYVGKIYSPNRLLRLFTWNVPMNDGTHRYFGFVQYFKPEGNKMNLLFLNESETTDLDEDHIYTQDDWYGCLYYHIIESKCGNQLFYTLLGFDFNNNFTTRKVIDVISFNNEGMRFGQPLFQLDGDLKKRVIYEYSSRVTMMIRYDTELQMIVFDHLSPSEPQYKDHYQFYGPDSSYDGFEFRDCSWKIVRDLDMKNKIKF